MTENMTTAQLLAGLKAAGESTRLRLLALLSRRELNVTDLTRVLNQSQPRISRHLKLLASAGLIERFREGSWVYFRLAGNGGSAGLAQAIVETLDTGDPMLERDRVRADAVLSERAEAAQFYFKEQAGNWDVIRGLHVSERQVEKAMLGALGKGPFNCLVDLGTGTGRILELFAPYAKRAVGVDVNLDMLAYARAKLDASDLHNCQVRHGDLFSLSFADNEADAVVLHQVLHYLEDPAGALMEAARILEPGGRLLIVDFAPHELEFLRDVHAHRRLGLSTRQVDNWVSGAGLKPMSHELLEPEGEAAQEKLTVSIWVAEKSGATAQRSKPTHSADLEAAQ